MLRKKIKYENCGAHVEIRIGENITVKVTEFKNGDASILVDAPVGMRVDTLRTQRNPITIYIGQDVTVRFMSIGQKCAELAIDAPQYQLIQFVNSRPAETIER